MSFPCSQICSGIIIDTEGGGGTHSRGFRCLAKYFALDFGCQRCFPTSYFLALRLVSEDKPQTDIQVKEWREKNPNHSKDHYIWHHVVQTHNIFLLFCCLWASFLPSFSANLGKLNIKHHTAGYQVLR